MRQNSNGFFIILISLLLFLWPVSTTEGELLWSTFLGGSDNEQGNGIALDDSGYVYLIGSTRSTNFPVTAGAFDTSYNTKTDACVLKLNPAGQVLEYATYLGGARGDRGYAIAVDDSGRAYTVGFAYSEDFPCTPGAFDSTHDSPGGSWADVFLARLNPTGSALEYSTLFGSTRGEGGYNMVLDDAGNVYIAGETESAGFPVTPEAFDTTFNGTRDAFVLKFDLSANELIYSTFLGGSSFEYMEGIAVDSAGNAYVTGQTLSADFPTPSNAFDVTHNGGGDAFIAKLNTDGSDLEYGAFLGSSATDRGNDIAVDDSGAVYLVGYTASAGFPDTPGAFDNSLGGASDAFVARIDPSGEKLEYASFLGGSVADRGSALAMTAQGQVLLTGRTKSADFPTTAGAFDTSHNGNDDVFVTLFDIDANRLVYSTYLGGEEFEYGNDITADTSGNIYLTGVTRSPDFPMAGAGFDHTYNVWDDIFAAKMSLDITAVEAEEGDVELPGLFALHQNSPNPFNSTTRIRYDLRRTARVVLKIYNILGAEVTTLADGDRMVGSYEVKWDAADLASGMYFCRLQAGEYGETVKMVLLR